MNEPIIRVYVAGPLFGSGRSTANVNRAIKAAERLRAAHMWPFVPHLFHYWDTVSPHEDVDYWLSMDRVWLESCDVMVRLGGKSPGSMREEQWCDWFGIPIYYEGDGEKGLSQLVSEFSAGKIQSRQRLPEDVFRRLTEEARSKARDELRASGDHYQFTLNHLQVEQGEWGERNFGPQPGYRMLLGVMEELGELSHAHLKAEQGIRGTAEKHAAAKIDAVGDVLVYLAAYCNSENIDMDEAARVTWESVRKRDWKKNPQTGGTG